MGANPFDQFDTANPFDQFDEAEHAGAADLNVAPPDPTFAESAADSALALGSGVVQGVKMLSDAAGADNPVSRQLGRAVDALGEMESPGRKAEKRARAEKIRQAEATGNTWQEVKAHVGTFADAPLDTTLNALGTSAPTLISALATGGTSLGPQLIARAAPALIGAAQGVGNVKGQIHEAVKGQHRAAGLSEEEASARADAAQAYAGDNLGSIALGGGLGALAGSTGAEAAVRRLVGRQLAEAAAERAAPGVLRSAATGVAKEAPMEAAQGGQERLASNLALQGEGFDTPTWQGVAGQAALEGLASAPMGGGFGAVEGLRARGIAPAPADPADPALDASPAPAEVAAPTTPAPAAPTTADSLLERALAAAGIEPEALQPPATEADVHRLAELEVLESTTGLNPGQQAERQRLAAGVQQQAAQEQEHQDVGEPAAPADPALNQVQALAEQGQATAKKAAFAVPAAEVGPQPTPTQETTPHDGPTPAEVATPAASARQQEAEAAAPVAGAAPGAAPGAQPATAPAGGSGVHAAGVAPSRAKTWPQFVAERGADIMRLKRNSPEWNALMNDWSAVQAGRERATAPAEPAAPTIQNRDRSRPAAVAQMQSMAAKPDYMRLGPSRSPETGAPLVFAVGGQAPVRAWGREDVAVMSDGQRVPFRYAIMEADQVQPSNFADGGVNPAFDSQQPGTVKALNNGRAAGLRAAYERGTAQGYRRELVQDAQVHGIAPAAIEAMRAPALVRVYDEQHNGAHMGARSQGQALGLSASEQASTDAALLDASALEVFEAGSLDSAANRDFARAFVGRLQQQGQDVAGMLDARGQLSPAGVSRVQAALVHKAYGDTDLVESLFGSTDNDIRAIGEALKTVAGEWANLRHAVQAGAVNPQVDVTGNLLAAVRLVQKARREGSALYDAIHQRDVETGQAPDPLTVGLLRLLYAGPYLQKAVGRERLTDSLRGYIGAALATRAEGDMFGEQVGPSEILTGLNGRTEGERDGTATTTEDPGATQGGRQSSGGDATGGGAEPAGGQARRWGTAGAGPQTDELGRSRSGQDAEAAGQQPDRQGAEGAGEDGRGAVGEGDFALEAPTREDVLARQEQQEQGAADTARTEREAEQRAQADAERGSFALTGSDRAADVLEAQGQQPMFSRSADTRAAYEARIDALFAGEKPRAQGVRVLDRSDVLALLGLGEGPVHVVEGKVEQGRFNHGLSAQDWKKVPEWLEGPAAVFDSDTSPGRLVFIAPELVRGSPVRMVIDPRPDGNGVNLLINAYDAERNPFQRWEREGLLRYFDKQKAPAVTGSFQPRLTGLPGDRGRGKILTEKHLAGYRRANDPAFSFAGARAATADTHALVTAQDRLAAGEDAETVRQETGWHRGADGRMRFEINDSDASYVGKAALEAAAEADPYKMAELPLAEVLQHPALFAAYPALREVRVAYEASAASKGDLYVGASYNQRDSVITLGNGLTEGEQLSALLHEVQHGIQTIEGFATGASMERLAKVMPDAQAINDAKLLARFMARGESAFEARQRFMQYMGRDPNPQGVYIAERYEPAEVARMARDAWDGYRRSAGEVEARNTQARQSLTDEQRRATPPSSTADVADADVIVTFNGKEMASAPAPANAAGFDFEAMRRAVLGDAPAAPARMPPAAAPGATTTQVAGAIRRAYGNLLDKLQAKGLVTLVQTEEDAVEAAAQARAAKTGQSVERARVSLRASVKNSLSPMKSIDANIRRGREALARALDGKTSVHRAMYRNGLGWVDFVWGDEGGAVRKDGSRPGEKGIAHILEARRRKDGMTEAQTLRLLDGLIETIASGAEVRRRELGGSTRAVIGLRNMEAIVVKNPGSNAWMLTGWEVKPGAAVAANDTIRATHRQADSSDLAVGAGKSSVTQGGLDIKRSAAGAVEGFYDPVSGQSFLVADGLTEATAPGTLMHEVGIHMAAEPVTRALFGRAQLLVRSGADPFMRRVRQRMDAAGETSAEEAAAYIVTEYENDRAAAPATARRWVQDFLAAIRAWAYRQGVLLKADQLTPADIAAVARANARRVARAGAPARERQAGGRQTAGERQVPAFARAAPPADPSQGRMSRLQQRVGDLLGYRSVDDALYAWQDKFIDLKRIQARIKDLDGVVNQTNDAYRGEELYHKRVAKRVSNFQRDEVVPLVRAMKAAKVGKEELEQFLHARHAPEANAELARRNPSQATLDAERAQADKRVHNLRLQLQRAQAQGGAVVPVQKALAQALAEKAKWDGVQAFQGTEEERLSLSGMSDDEAAGVMQALSPERRRQLDSLAARVDHINDGTLETLEGYGLMERGVLTAWRKTYQHYVPLHRDEAHPDSHAHPIGQGFSTKGDASKLRAGSNERVTNILAHVLMQREAALTRGEKNNVVKRLYLLAAQNPDPELWSLDAPKKKAVDPDTGLVRTMVDQAALLRDNVVRVRIGGQDKFIVFNERNERTARLAVAVKNLDAMELDRFTRLMGKLTRWFSAVNTQYNPVFGAVNIIRDVQAMLLQLSSTPLAGRQGEVLKSVAANLPEIYRDLRAQRKGAGLGQGPWAKLWEQMQLDGGTTGYRDLYATPEDRAKALDKELAKLDQGKASAAAEGIVGWLSDYNEALENTTRLGVYKVALDQGLSRQDAASIAKNITVNFNRKGRNTAVMGSWFAFLNAAIQGTTRMAETLAGPAGRKVMIGGVALGMLSAAAGMAMMGGGGADDEWKKIPEFVKDRSIIIPLGRQDYVAIPMPLGFHVFPNIGRKMVEFATHDDPVKSRAGYLADMALISLNAFNPLGGAENLMQMVTPTPFDPVVAVAMNRDWTGRPIEREKFSASDPAPGHARAKDAASQPARWVSRGINAATGGNEWREGAWSPTPDALDYLFGQLTGGVGRELVKAGKMVAATTTGEELAPHQIVLAGRFYGNTRGANGQSQAFYENVKRINGDMAEAKGRVDGGEAADGVLRDVPLAPLEGAAKQVNKRLSELRKMRRQVQEAGGEDKIDQVKAINAEIEQHMYLLNQAVEGALAQRRGGAQ